MTFLLSNGWDMRRLYPTWTLDQWYWDGGVIVDMLEYAGIVFLGIILTLFLFVWRQLLTEIDQFVKFVPILLIGKIGGFIPIILKEKKYW